MQMQLCFVCGCSLLTHPLIPCRGGGAPGSHRKKDRLPLKVKGLRGALAWPLLLPEWELWERYTCFYIKWKAAPSARAPASENIASWSLANLREFTQAAQETLNHFHLWTFSFINEEQRGADFFFLCLDCCILHLQFLCTG